MYMHMTKIQTGISSQLWDWNSLA